ncbi:LysR family transcriptional regulator [Kribbella sp. NPDC048915]|uniref:LysR family transcriptional regulator n=1 Tax=Kribbella sp. NPDC048915 TaxID=3155148 RepID=UPI0033D255B2
MLDLRRLRLLHALATHGTIAAAAKACHLSGPAVSQQLTQLEREVGVPVVERVGRSVRLTDAGHVLVGHTRIVLDQLAAAEADLVALGTSVSGTVRIAAFSSAVATVVAASLQSVRAVHGPALQFQIATLEPTEGLKALQRGDADLLVTYSYDLEPQTLPPWSEERRLLAEPIVLMLHENDPLNDGTTGPVELARLQDRDWVVPSPGSTCRAMIDKACAAAGFVPHTVAYSTDFPTMAAVVAAGGGVALLPRAAAFLMPGCVVLRSIDPPTYRQVLAVTRRGGDRHPAVRVALDHLSRAAGRQASGDEP